MTQPTKAVREACLLARNRHRGYRMNLGAGARRLSGLAREAALATVTIVSADAVAEAVHLRRADLWAALPTARPTEAEFAAAARHLRGRIGKGESDYTRLVDYPTGMGTRVSQNDLVTFAEDRCSEFRRAVLATRNLRPRAEKDRRRDGAERMFFGKLYGLIALDAAVRGPEVDRAANRVWAAVALDLTK